jgi:RNA polymerase sigma-70 factor (ECF subfamily)
MDLSTFSDERLMEMVVEDGKSSAFEELMRRYLRPVYGFLVNYLQEESAAEDCAQEAFFKAWKNSDQFKPQFKFKTWLFSIARNSALDYLKKKKTYSFSYLEKDNEDWAENLADSAPSLEDIFSRLESKEKVEKILSILEPKDREILLLHYTEELTFEEIAMTLNEPLNTVKSRHLRVLRKLRDRLEGDAPERIR